MPRSSSSFTSEASLKRGGGSVKCCSGSSDFSVSFCPASSGGSLCLSSSSSSSLLSLDSSYNLRKPSNFITDPVTRNQNTSLPDLPGSPASPLLACWGGLASMSTEVWSNTAGFICDATKRCQISL